MKKRPVFWWVPNVLTLSRLFLAVVVLLLAANEVWAWAFWLFVLALLTDFLDGLAAKKLNAHSEFGREVDPLADAALVGGGFLGLTFGGALSWWVTIPVLLAAAVIGSERFFRYRKKRMAVAMKVMSVSALFVEWIFVALWLAAQAFGWSWWYLAATLAVLVFAAMLKRHRLRAWLGLEGRVG